MSYQSLYKIYVTSDTSEFNKIYENRFNSEASIKFPIKIKDNQCFFFYHNDISSLICNLKYLEKRVEKAYNKLPDVAKKQYIKKSLIDEIQFTNEIEGVISTRKDINNILEDISVNLKEKNRLESIINKYYLINSNVEIEINTASDIRKLYDEMLYHEIKMDDPKNLPDGELFRKNTVHVFRQSEKFIHEGINPESKIIDYLNEGLKILNDTNIDPYVRIAIFHYLFAYIHPFYDGNGRLARFISSYELSKNFIPIIGYRLSMTIKENLTRYLDAFKYTNDIRNKGDLSTFVYEFLKIISIAYQKTELYALEKRQELDKYKSLISNFKFDKKVKELLFYLIQCELFSEFGLSKANLQTLLNCSHATCSKILNELENNKLLKTFINGKRKYYSINLDNLNIL